MESEITAEEQYYQQFGARVEEKYIVQQKEANQIQTPSLGLGQDSTFGLVPLCFLFFPFFSVFFFS